MGKLKQNNYLTQNDRKTYKYPAVAALGSAVSLSRSEIASEGSNLENQAPINIENPSDAEMHMMFDSLKNKDDVITEDEINHYALFINFNQQDGSAQEFNWVEWVVGGILDLTIDVYDEDHDGALSYQEFAELIEDFTLGAIDLNGDDNEE